MLLVHTVPRIIEITQENKRYTRLFKFHNKKLYIDYMIHCSSSNKHLR